MGAASVELFFPLGGQAGAAPFNGYGLSFVGDALITGVTVGSLSTLVPTQVTFTYDTININIAGETFGAGDTILDVTTVPVPEPGSLALFAAGLTAIMLWAGLRRGRRG